jgi:hypothetical protein
MFPGVLRILAGGNSMFAGVRARSSSSKDRESAGKKGPLMSEGLPGSCNQRLLNVVFPARREDIDDQRIVQGRGLMFDTAANHETVARERIERGFANCNSQMSAYDVNDLLVGMTVPGTNPTFLHAVFGEKKLVVVRTNATDKTGLRRLGCSVRRWDEHEVGMCAVYHVLQNISLNSL